VSEDTPLFAVVDVETTGFSPIVGDRIVELGIVRSPATARQWTST
jgi:DNA polymerase III epsilon subunit-like protein